MRLLGPRLLVEPIPPLTTSTGGIVIPTAFNDNRMTFKVVAVGPGKRLKNGSVRPVEAQPGDKILCTQYHGNLHAFDDGKLIVDETDVVMVWK